MMSLVDEELNFYKESKRSVRLSIGKIRILLEREEK
jgi:hypothetical protein